MVVFLIYGSHWSPINFFLVISGKKSLLLHNPAEKRSSEVRTMPTFFFLHQDELGIWFEMCIFVPVRLLPPNLVLDKPYFPA